MLEKRAKKAVENRAKSPSDLSDGIVFHHLLEILDEQYDGERFEQHLDASNDDQDHTSRGLHIICAALNKFASRECPDIKPLAERIDSHRIDGDPKRLLDVLTVLLSASVMLESLDKRNENVQLITTDLQASGGTIMALIQGAQELIKSDDTADGADSSMPAGQETGDDYDNDNELLLEQERAHWQHEAEEAHRRAANLKLRLDRLQDNHDEMMDKHAKLQDENEELRKQIESEMGNYDKHRLQQQLRDAEAVIANLEERIETSRDEMIRLERENKTLETRAKKADALADDNQELKIMIDDLTKKANMAENYRKKVEAFREQEVELQSLRNDKFDLAGITEQLRQADQKIKQYRREASEYSNKMQQYELEYASFRDQKSLWTSENTALRMRVQVLEERAQSDEQIVKDLQEKIMMVDPSAALEMRPAIGSSSLEDELSENPPAVSMKDLEIQRLQAENTLLRSSIGTEGDKGQLLVEMEDLKSSYRTLQEKFNEMTEKHILGQKQIDALSKDRDSGYHELRTQFLAEQAEVKALTFKLQAAQQELADKDRDLVAARGDLSTVEKATLEQLDELKRTDGMLAVSLRTELDAKRTEFKSLKDLYENAQTQLLNTLVDRDEVRRQKEELARQLQGQPEGPGEFMTQEKFEKIKQRHNTLKSRIDEMETKNRELERTVKELRSGSELVAEKAQRDQKIKHLQRENALLTSAWYDLNSRMQSNHVVLQRRQDMPKSWLNKQRQLVNGTCHPADPFPSLNGPLYLQDLATPRR
ncbi:uncharacterized protein B0I36DRAFT_233682 [Microdochium trichocladiopsis]|uniref:HOOK N-terminal domain-containing protein n=1 Tax=Microdochium trichocladiopsis TaxID=1682393 RepID=A0A9P8YIF9_9PEZI|nr:uncharacterized protein B0I36DRAFT_233682 [Microdochium trichocladiopsis]KAH7040597.1 hypothetical protein B0I36DRAFT_233682 [Microdochium trichocladiopsis]